MLNTDEETLARLSEMEATIATNNQHIRDMAKQVDFLDHALTQLLDRLGIVERKTSGLSDKPGRRNCPTCTKIVTTLGPNCSHCGNYLFE